ncbi:MAG TPA: DUF488 family protein [Candidatus Saccharimonadales bacterium]|jgi:uncharacterized protein YeaO (DUF488 family)
MVAIKRIYNPTEPSDGYRVLVDRLWPRGVSKEKARLDGWLKEVAPSEKLRKWFGHKPERFEMFRKKYREELKTNPAREQLEAVVKAYPAVTLLYAAHDPEHNQARVLCELLAKRD